MKQTPSFLFFLFFLLSFIHLRAQSEDLLLKITHLTGDFYIYTTYNTYENNKVPAHGMYLVARNGVVLFDTPWDTTQFQPLLDSIQQRHHKKVVACVATHWHSDRTAGLDYYRQQKIHTYTTLLTDELSKKNQTKRAEFLLSQDTTFQFDPYTFQTYYPGQGHTADNIIIWFNKEKILYGGCLIKGVEAEDLGYLGNANVAEYETTLKKVRKKCRTPQYIIVSHHDWTNSKSLDHSIHLASKLRKKKERE